MHPGRPTIEPSDEQLRAAWRELAAPEWGSFEDAARAAGHYALVRTRARIRANGQQVAAAATSAHAQPPAPSSPRFAPPVPRTPPQFDRMRAASGEREET